MTILYPNGSRVAPAVSSAFGPRPSFPTPGGWTLPYHYGVDTVGYQVVCSPIAGVVTFAGEDPDFGWLVTIREPDGTRHRLAHHKHLYVELGQPVNPGTPVGRMGMSGKATGIHSHWEVLVHGVRVDPMTYIRNRLAEPAATPEPSKPQPTPESEEPYVYIANVKGDFFLILPTPTGPRGHLLGAASEARASGIPIIKYTDDWAVTQLQKTVTLVR